MTDHDDRYDQLCTECEMGRYHETSIHDDWDGVLHCTNKKCNHEVKRYKWKDNPPPKLEKVKLSPAAQSVLDAAINVAESPDAESIAAAVLRAVADQVVPIEYEDIHGCWYEKKNRVREQFLAIANELEAK
jgi:hypothetical protein